MSDKLLLLERGGAYVFGNGLCPSGKFSVSFRDFDLEKHFTELYPGGYVVDKLAISNREEFPQWVVSCPLIDLQLPKRSVERFGRRVHQCMLENVGCFDHVGIELYLDYWRAKGARIGKRVDDSIHWESGDTSSI